MSDKLTLDKRTTISVSLLVVIIPALVYVIGAWSRVQAQVEQNRQDIISVHEEIKDLSSNLVKTNDKLDATNQNLVRVGTLLDNLNKSGE